MKKPRNLDPMKEHAPDFTPSELFEKFKSMKPTKQEPLKKGTKDGKDANTRGKN